MPKLSCLVDDLLVKDIEVVVPEALVQKLVRFLDNEQQGIV